MDFPNFECLKCFDFIDFIDPKFKIASTKYQNQDSHHAQAPQHDRDIQDSGAEFTGMIGMVDFNMENATFIDTDLDQGDLFELRRPKRQ